MPGSPAREALTGAPLGAEAPRAVMRFLVAVARGAACGWGSTSKSDSAAAQVRYTVALVLGRHGVSDGILTLTEVIYHWQAFDGHCALDLRVHLPDRANTLALPSSLGLRTKYAG